LIDLLAGLNHIHTGDTDATQLSSWLASPMWIGLMW